MRITSLLVPLILLTYFPQVLAVQGSPDLSAVIGTWKGESICTGNCPACKNEIVVYRFEAVSGKTNTVMLFGDKIIKGQREPMGKLEFQYDPAKKMLTGEFRNERTHVVFQFTVAGDTIEGTLISLPNKEVGRRIKVKRVSPNEVPAAPAKEAYDGM